LRRSRNRSSWAPLALTCLVQAASLACASPLVAVEGDHFRHRELGFRIAAPVGPPGPWTRAEVGKTSLSFRAPGGRSMSLVWRCGRIQVSGPIRARQLLIGLEQRSVQTAAEEEIAGQSGWFQRVAARDGGRGAHLLTFSRSDPRCYWDFLLVTRQRDAAAEEVWRRWIGTFRPRSAALWSPAGNIPLGRGSS